MVWGTISANTDTATFPITVSVRQIVTGSHFGNNSNVTATVGYVSGLFGISSWTSTTITRVGDGNSKVRRFYLIVGN